MVLVVLLVGLLGFVGYGINLKESLENRAAAPDFSSNNPIVKNVELVIFDPVLTHHGNIRLTQYFSQKFPGLWASTDVVGTTNKIIDDLKTVSGGYVNYRIIETKTIDSFPVKVDGFQYDDDSWLACWNDHSKCHSPDSMDYLKELGLLGSCEKRNVGTIDEVWFWGGPWFGFYESNLAGHNAFWYNSPPLPNSPCQPLLPIMGFNYERSEDLALHSFGHRVESTMVKVYGGWDSNENTPWNTFTLLNKDVASRARCGNVHFPPNGVHDYDYANSSTVNSACDDWYQYPHLPTTPQFKPVSCETWDCTQYGYLLWWFKHIPKAPGLTNGVWNNWWKYVVDYENAVLAVPTPTPPPCVNTYPCPTPVPTPVPTPTETFIPTPPPTPTPAVCSHNYPTVRLAPSSETSLPGETRSFSLTVTDNDSSACPQSTFSITPVRIPGQWRYDSPLKEVALNPGASQPVVISLTPPSSAPAGRHVFSEEAYNIDYPNLVSIVSGSYTVTSAAPTKTAVPSPTTFSNGCIASCISAITSGTCSQGTPCKTTPGPYPKVMFTVSSSNCSAGLIIDASLGQFSQTTAVTDVPGGTWWNAAKIGKGGVASAEWDFCNSSVCWTFNAGQALYWRVRDAATGQTRAVCSSFAAPPTSTVAISSIRNTIISFFPSLWSKISGFFKF